MTLMPNVFIKDMTLVPSDPQTATYHFVDWKRGQHWFRQVSDQGKTAILNSRIDAESLPGTRRLPVSEILSPELTSLCIENPGAIPFDDLHYLLTHTTNLLALSLASYFHHNNTERHKQLTNLIALALSNNPQLKYIELMACPLSEELFAMLTKAAEAGRLVSCKLSDHDYRNFRDQQIALDSIIRSNQPVKRDDHKEPSARILADSMARGLGTTDTSSSDTKQSIHNDDSPNTMAQP
jgi:hypothetical protein